ncbi:hypothetical protein GCM10025783_28770 [Amnibacterium soli]|uniref:Signal transduction histidine kinase n=1 Tax=Amnibacterium soli TaxID=1282736 RepID=A0ABP8ZE61_9MICO
MTSDSVPAPVVRVGALRFQKYLGLIVGAFGLLYALQTLDALAAGWPTMSGTAGGAAVALVAGSVLLGSVAGIAPSRARSLFLGAAILFCGAVAVWPFSISGPVPATPMPWFIGLMPVQAAYLAVSFQRLVVPTVGALLISAGVTGVLIARGGLGLAESVENGLFGVAVSVVLIVLIAAVRRGVARADSAQQAALDGYGRSLLDEATESERVRTDALVHDSVLTTFLAAAAARDPESEELARRMASNALRVLAHVNRSEDAGPAVPFGKVLIDEVDRFDPIMPGWDVEVADLADLVLPAQAAQMIVTAMLHSMTGSVQHSGAERRSLTMSELGPDGIRVVIADDGAPVDLGDPDDPRAVLHRTVIDLMRVVDGRADIATRRGSGTVVTLSWGSVVVTGTAPRPEPVEASA